MKIKMYCIFAKDSIKKMNGNRGKMSTQAGHAFLHGYWDSVRRFPDMAKAYQDSDYAYKITLVVESTENLEEIYNSYKDLCGVTLVKDAGFTVFDEPTITCVGVGPISEDLIKDDLKALKLLI